MELRIVVCLALGLATEFLAHWFRLWKYRSPLFLVSNVALVFAGIFGTLAYAFRDQPFWLQFAIGAAFGILYESANLAFLNAWSFPGNKLFFLRGKIALALGVGLSWGAIPVLTGLLL